MNLYSFLESGFPTDRNAVCIEVAGEKSYTWKELEENVARIANWLMSLHLPEGARIASITDKSTEALWLYLGTLRAGYAYFPLNTAYLAAELEHFLGDAQPSVVVCGSKNREWIEPLVKKFGIEHIFTLDDDHTGTLLDASQEYSTSFGTVVRTADDLAVILYTSGTTGRSKGAMLTHGNLTSNAKCLHEFWHWRSNDILLHILPIFHIHGLFVAIHGALFAGAKMIWMSKFDAQRVVNLLERSTVMMGVPTHYVRLLAERSLTAGKCKAMRLFICGSAPLPIDTLNQFQKRTGHTILERYGMTETGMLVSNPYDHNLGARIGGSVGMPLPGVDVRIVTDAGEPCAVGEVGRIQVKGPNIFKGYWRLPEKTAEEFTTDGWFNTGDLGRWGGESEEKTLPESYISIVGRSKDLIISGGYNIYPKEIENVIDEISGIMESAVIGLPHPDFGEAVAAVIVPKENTPINPLHLKETLKKNISSFKVPKEIFLVRELPRNSMGKVEKKLLKETYKNTFQLNT